jgi:beta-lactamase class A
MVKQLKTLQSVIAVIGLIIIPLIMAPTLLYHQVSRQDTKITTTKAATKSAKQQVNLFDSQFLQFLKTRTDSISVAIYDEDTGQTYTYHPNSVYCPASTIKVLIMAETLEVTDGDPTEDQKELLTTMIENSDNDSASDLWEENGGTTAMQAFMSRIGMHHTVANNAWGLTTTTAPDMLKAMELFALPNDVLTTRERRYGLEFMENVEADQNWGVSAGVSQNETIAIKNGWSPETWSNWRINSLGDISGHQSDYVISVYTINNPTEQYGIDTIQGVSKIIWTKLSTS